jgi:hypothetical protein
VALLHGMPRRDGYRAENLPRGEDHVDRSVRHVLIAPA